jgi:hypothetical protein
MDDPTEPEKGSVRRTPFDDGDLYDALFGDFGFDLDFCKDLAERGMARPSYRQAFYPLLGR